MTQRVTRSITVRRHHEDVAAFVTDPHRFLEAVPGFGRFQHVGDGAESGEEEWDVFLQVGTLHVGGRVLVQRPSASHLEWHSLRGTSHTFTMTVEPLAEQSRLTMSRLTMSRLTMSLSYTLAGGIAARVTEKVAGGIVGRHLDAGLEQVRHELEHEDTRT